MPRLASALLVIGLLVATAAAFAVTERLKLVRSPILETQLDRRVFSPVCGCESATVEIGFRLRNADRLSVTIVDTGGRTVSTLIAEERRPAGPVTVRWDGRGDDGSIVAEGTYKPRVHLAGQRRTIELPNPMRLDTTPPEVAELDAQPLTFSPDGDSRRDKVAVRYRLSEEGRAELYVGGELRVTHRRRTLAGKIDWHGLAGERGLPRGPYELSLVAVDRAGNRSDPAGPVTVTIRYVELSRKAIRVRAGSRFSVRVATDAESFSWRLGRAGGSSVPGVLVVRAPERPGRYALVVQANDRRARANVTVEAARAG
ncbi:MAG: FlgD immunoglobulin-like domain containing protein [Gaiellaceae bacterium]